MGKALFGSLYVHPALSDDEVTRLEALELGYLSITVDDERDRLTAWPAFDEGDGDMKTLVAELRGFGKHVFMNALLYADSGGPAVEDWLVIDDEVQCYHYGTSIPYVIKQWIDGEAPDRVHGYAAQNLDTLQRTTFQALRIAATLDRDAETIAADLRDLAGQITDPAHAKALLDEHFWIACKDVEMTEEHWLDWRVRAGTLGSLVTRVALDPALAVSDSDYEAYRLKEGSLRDRRSDELATGVKKLAEAASLLGRTAAVSLLADCARDLGVTIPLTDPAMLAVALEKTVEDWGHMGGYLFARFGVDGVTEMLPALLAALRAYEGDADRKELQQLLEWTAYVCRQEQAEKFSEAAASSPDLVAWAEAGAVQCS